MMRPAATRGAATGEATTRWAATGAAVIRGATTRPAATRGRACARGAAALAALAAAACASRDIVAETGGSAAFCSGRGPAILVGDSGPVCTGAVAVRTFARALCTCEGYATSTALTTDSFDSDAGPYVPGGTTGDVGIDGELRTSARVDVGGAVAVAGVAGASLLADLHVAHDLAVAGPLGTGVTVTAGGDAHVAGSVDLTALTVAGTLTVDPTAGLGGTITAGATVRAPVDVAPPCACSPDDLVDIPAFVAGHAGDNQDDAIGLLPGRLTDYHGAVTLDLPCGIYYVGPIRGDGELTLRITGRAALLVDGDLSLTAPFTVELATDDAELDLMVAGILSSGQAIVIGRADHPARARVYIGGSGTIELSGDSHLAANLYAPRAAVALSGSATIHGSLFVRRLDQSGPVDVHYDLDVRRADVACTIERARR